MNNCRTNQSTNIQKTIVLACDFIMLSTCCFALYYAFYVNRDLLLIWLIINVLSTITFRTWLYHTLQIPWLLSPLNRGVKRLFDIVSCVLFLCTLFPLIYLIQAIITKKVYGGEVLSFYTISIKNKEAFNVLAFKQNSYISSFYLNLSPIALHILIGKLSLWDLKTIQQCDNTKTTDKGIFHAIPHTQTTEEQNEENSHIENTQNTEPDETEYNSHDINQTTSFTKNQNEHI